MAAKRLSLLAPLEMLTPAPEIEPLGKRIKAAIGIPDGKATDAYHLAFAVHHKVDYLLTWNCAHLANPGIERALTDFTRANDLWLPIVCTPEEMSEEDAVL